jgi:UDP-N-acetylglucosamine 2-epimerase (non-hydrolysing)
VNIPAKKYVVVNIHRFENLRSKNIMKKLVEVLNDLTKAFHIVFILHNPTKKAIEKFALGDAFHKDIEFRDRYDYFRFIKLIAGAEFVISDGGSNQEECFYLGKPILLYRKTSERQDGIGRNVFISAYKTDSVNDFVANYMKYARSFFEVDDSPSDMIVKFIQKYANPAGTPPRHQSNDRLNYAAREK